MRLDDGVRVFERLESGRTPIVRGDRARSELWRRITAEDPADRMPPASTGKRLTGEQIERLGQWIDAGAGYEPHWSFVAPRRPRLPAPRRADWARNPIDLFILARLEREGLEPSPEADGRTLIRRATLDLTGLPPTIPEIEAFLDDESPEAYERQVERLLASPHYGEQMARLWLDSARYADTNGYHIDNERTMWRWRDWTIEAMNANLPFDRFTIEQLAGDLLPEPTEAQLIATGFNRNHMINFEGGAIPEEYQVQYVVDRLTTTATVWMGLTIGCAQCHDHKYDPISQREFYGLYAFFNTIAEEGLDGREGNAAPRMSAPTPEQARARGELKREVTALRERLEAPLPWTDVLQGAWEREASSRLTRRWQTLAPASATSSGGATLTVEPDGAVLAGGENPDSDVYELTFRTDAEDLRAIRLTTLGDSSLPEGGPGRAENAQFVLSEFEVEAAPAGAADQFERVRFVAAEADGARQNFDVALAIDGRPETGWAPDPTRKGEEGTAVFVAERPFGQPGGSVLRVRLRHESKAVGHGLGRFRLAATADPALQPTTWGPWRLNGPYPAADGPTAYTTAYRPETGPIRLEATDEDGRLKWVPRADLVDGRVHDLPGEIAATYLLRTIKAAGPRRLGVALGTNDGVKVWLNGRVILDKNVPRPLKEGEDVLTLDLLEGENRLLMKVVNYGAAYQFHFKKTAEQLGELPLDVERLLLKAAQGRSEAERRRLREHFRGEHSPAWRAEREALTAAEARAAALEASLPTAMIMREMAAPRETHVLVRGQYDQPGERVEAAVPAFLPRLPPGAPVDRLGLARWLVSPEHPLTARVIVNRFWQHYFGVGLVKTAEDFGIQGEWPTHPDLLDWLATEFVASGWDVKALQRLIVTSATYRQSSRHRPDAAQRDPENRLLAQGPRFRMDAEMIRDNALAVSGLLVPRIGGPSVRPYQPAGLWEAVAYGANYTAQKFVQDHGENLYRRSMYTFWKRQSPPPTLVLFDAPNRETCIVRRSRTNTPLQALALMNDPQFVEAARALAQRMLREPATEASAETRLAFGFALATARPPTSDERGVLLETLAAERAHFETDREAAARLIGVGESPADGSLDPAELAAWTSIASILLNLDETITRG